MAKEGTQTGQLGSLQRFSVALAANSSELTHLEASRLKLGSIGDQAQDTAKRQAALRAEKQELSKQLKTLLVEGTRLANVLRKAVLAHYGIRAEKLAEFGLQPFRGRTRKAQTTPEGPQTPTPTSSTPAHATPPAAQ
ncbi:MAG: hypothetical protein QOF89_1942 [Acidobacteriota bacterium]|jgi:septal ring factor EnvC (AmiA/AmiB activator)|nr:hypothetical protein [Acidobacteriota bacterium]